MPDRLSHIRKRLHRSPKSHRWLSHLSLPPPPNTDDPAFSADPQFHPYHYLTGYEWTLPLAPGHPTLQGRRHRRQRRSKALQTNDSQGDSDSELELIQPPNSPAPTDNNNEAFPFQVQRIGPPSGDLPSASTTAPRAAMNPSLAKDPKPTKTLFGFLTKRQSPKRDTARGGRTLVKASRRSEESRPSPSQKPSASVLQRRKSVPGPQLSSGIVEQENAEKGAAGPGSEATATNWAVPAADINHHQHTATVPRSQPKRLDLDSIDELDETNVFGARIHHDGPYEAIRSVVGGSQSRMPLGLSDNGRLHQYHERTMKAVGHVYMLPEAPPGVPLNLSPGQVLPRNFRRQAGKPPRLRNNVVAPLPLEEVVEDVASHHQALVPPRLANFNEIPFHKGARKAKPRQNFDNPLDGPPIDASVAIGLAMMYFRGGTDDDDESLPVTPNPVAVDAQQQPQVVDAEFEYNPYAPENIEDHILKNSPPSHPKGEVQPLPLPAPAVYSSDGRQEEQEMEESPAVQPAGVYSRSPSPSARSVLLTQGIKAGASEETLVQNEDERGCQEEPLLPPSQDVSDLPKLEEVILTKIEQASSPHAIPQQSAQDPTEQGTPTSPATLPEPRPTVDLQMEHHIVELNTLSPTPIVAGRYYNKQLPQPPANTPPLPPSPVGQGTRGPNDFQQQQAVRTPSGNREWKHSALQKALQRSDTRTTTRSSASYQSHSSTRGDDGHTPAANMSGTASSSNAAPQQLTSPRAQQQRPEAKSSPSMRLISRRDPIFSTDSLTRYPVPKPSPLSTSAAPDDKPRSIPTQRPLQKANSTSSSRKSFQLSPIQEDTPLPQQSISERVQSLAPQSQTPRPDPRLGQGLHRSQSSIQPRSSQSQVQVGQVYPRHLQTQGPPSLQRSVSQLVPQGRPPVYSEDPLPRQTLLPLSQEQYQQQLYQQQQQQIRMQVQSQIEMELEMKRLSGYDPRHPPMSSKPRPESQSYSSLPQSQPQSQHQIPSSMPRTFADDRRQLRAVNALSGVPEIDENSGYPQFSKDPQTRERNRARNSRVPEFTQQYPIRDSFAHSQSVMSGSTNSSSAPSFQRHHLPKNLVMPAPLQQHNQVPKAMPQAQHFNDIFGARPAPDQSKYYKPSRAAKPMPQPQVVTREPSPPTILPPLLSTSDMRLDPAISAGRKLKKRSSHIVPPPPPNRLDVSPHVALDFKPVIIAHSPSEKPILRPKPIPEKAAKRVLSKKRTNL